MAKKSMGLQVSELDSGQLEKLTKLMEPVKTDYVKFLNDKGLPGTAVFEAAQKMAMELTANE